jgi:hypothetical protein
MRRREAGRELLQVGPCRLQGRPRRHPGDGVVALLVAYRQVRRRGPERRPHAVLPSREREAAGHHADDRRRLAVEPQRPAEDGRIRAEGVAPELVGDEHQALAPLHLPRGPGAPEPWRDAQDAEELGVDPRRRDGQRLAARLEHRAVAFVEPETVQGPTLPAPVGRVEIRERDAVPPRGEVRVGRAPEVAQRLVDAHQASRPRIGKGREDRAGEGEGGGHRPHADGQGEDHGDGDQRPAPQRPPAQLLPHAAEDTLPGGARNARAGAASLIPRVRRGSHSSSKLRRVRKGGLQPAGAARLCLEEAAADDRSRRLAEALPGSRPRQARGAQLSDSILAAEFGANLVHSRPILGDFAPNSTTAPTAARYWIHDSYSREVTSSAVVQNAQRRAATGTSLRHSGHFFVVGSGGASPRRLRSMSAFTGRTTKK